MDNLADSAFFAFECVGYANLFHAMCQSVGLTSAKLGGWARSGGRKELHAWNAIKLSAGVTNNLNWYLLDVTWASGCVDGECFTHRYDMSYWCMDPKEFIKTHLPSAKKWQLLDTSVTKKQWENTGA